MVKPAQDGLGGELAEPLHLSTARRILPQGQMCSQFVVVVLTENAIRAGIASLRTTMSDGTGDEVRRGLGVPAEYYVRQYS
jgi:hypothetical protein